MHSSRISAGRLVWVRIEPKKEDQPEATGGEWRRVRSRGMRGLGERRAESCAYAAVVEGEEEGGGSGGMYGRRIAGCWEEGGGVPNTPPVSLEEGSRRSWMGVGLLTCSGWEWVSWWLRLLSCVAERSTRCGSKVLGSRYWDMYFSRWEGVVRWVDFAILALGSRWLGNGARVPEPVALVVFRVRGLKC